MASWKLYAGFLDWGDLQIIQTLWFWYGLGIQNLKTPQHYGDLLGWQHVRTSSRELLPQRTVLESTGSPVMWEKYASV